MPTREYFRLWCTKCKDWTLHEHHYPDWENKFCKECDTQHDPVLLSEIPEDKILEQRERYSQAERESINKIFQEMTMSSEARRIREMVHMFSPPGSDFDTHIVESDAGQKKIDEKIREERAKVIEEKRQEKERMKTELAKYRGIQRNDTCPCGSGIKYKKCCLEKVNNSLKEYNLRF